MRVAGRGRTQRLERADLHGVVTGYPSDAPFVGEQGQVIRDIISGTGIGWCMCRIDLIAGGISRPHGHHEGRAALYAVHTPKQGVWTLSGWEFEHADHFATGGGKIIAPDVPHIAVAALDARPAEEGPPPEVSYTTVVETRGADNTRDDIEQLDELWPIALERIRELGIPVAESQPFVPEKLSGSLSGMALGLWYPRLSLP